MSNLSGRRKQFNPRVNTTWSQDANKCGQKMLIESVDCDIMLNVTSEPVKTKNGVKDFFNDVHSKIQKMNRRKWTKTTAPPAHLVIGDLESQIDHHQPHKEGLKLSFKKAGISKNVLHYHRASSLAYAKRSYKNFIKGDLILHFKNTNLYKIDGYGK